MGRRGSLLLISLGPIQDFIRSARRCQDLWFGSWLLSDLARAVGDAVQQFAGLEAVVVFPAGLSHQPGDGERPGVSNLIFAVLPDGVEPGAVARAAREALAEQLDEVAGHVFGPLREPSAIRFFHGDVAMQQLQDLMELTWVTVPCSSDGYARDRKALYARMAAVKNTKTWEQPTWTRHSGAGVPKSSLDGERESVIDESIFEAGPRGMGPTERRRTFGLKGQERLCGVGLLKRLGSELDEGRFREGKPAFHSTSHVAAGPVLRRIDAQGARGTGAVRDYLWELGRLGLEVGRFRVRTIPGGPFTLGGYDGSLLFPSRMKDHFTENFRGSKDDGPVRDFRELERTEQDRLVENGRGALRKLLAAVDGPSEPCPYYAYLLADGDNMGAAIDNVEDVDGHRGLARALNDFAAGCREVVAAHEGTLIFSGGDDVLALLPLHRALECARTLADDFQKALRAYRTRDGLAPSLSVGLAVAHAREPMSEARALAERAEKLAKANPGKNALAIIVAKRSGGDLSLVGSWSGEDAGDRDAAKGHPRVAESAGSLKPLDQRLRRWVQVLGDGELSSKTAHDLEQVAAHYDGMDSETQESRILEITALCKQVLARKRQRGGAGAANAEAIADLLAPVSRPGLRLAPAFRVRRLSEELQVARLFWQASQDAGTGDTGRDVVGHDQVSDEHPGVRE